MEIAVDPSTSSVALRDGANFRAFHVSVAGAADDAAVAAALAAAGAGSACADADHAWVAKSWLEAQAAAAPGGAPDGVSPEDWAAGYAKMLGLAAKMGWLDDAATHIKAHIERAG